MKKKHIAVISCACFLLTTVSMTVYAYLTTGDSKTNTVIIGENAMSLNDEFTKVTAQTKGDNIHDKSVSVTNENDVMCYVRIYLTFSDSRVAEISQLSWKDDAENNPVWTDALEYYGSALPEKWEYMTFNGTTWTKSTSINPDGWYYYTDPLEKGTSTSELIKQVKTTYANEKDIQDFDIYVYSESVQVYGKSGENVDYQTAWKEYLYPAQS